MKTWLAGVITIGVTLILTVGFIWVVSWALNRNSADSIRLPLLIVASVIGLLASIGFIVVAFSLYNLNNAAQPLGLPEGSVRALIALLILVIFAAMTVFFFSQIRDPTKPAGTDASAIANAKAATDAASDLAKQVLTILGTLLTAISSFYFGSQSATSAAKVAAGGPPPPVAAPNPPPVGPIPAVVGPPPGPGGAPGPGGRGGQAAALSGSGSSAETSTGRREKHGMDEAE